MAKRPKTPPSVRRIALDELRDLAGRDVAIYLSAGVDSTTLLFALLELDCRVTSYSCTLDDRESTDFRVARAMATWQGIRFVPVHLSTDRDELMRDVCELIQDHGLRSKTDVECSWPLWHALQVTVERVVVTGHGMGGHFGVSKKAMLHARKDQATFDQFRRDLFARPGYNQRPFFLAAAGGMGIEWRTPFIADHVRDQFLGCSWESLNKPHEKQAIIDAYPELYRARAQLGIHRQLRHSNLQLGDSGIADLFATLVDSPLNMRRHKTVVGVYHDVAKRHVPAGAV